ncbi:MAG: hypothetical protein QXU18_04510, partial [Thermoplasmatales archaeon]
MPLRLKSSRVQNLYISRKLKTDLDPDELPQILCYVGNHFPDLYDMFRKVIEPGDLIFYDLTSITSYSKNLKLKEKGYNANYEHENQVTVVIAFQSVHGYPRQWWPFRCNRQLILEHFFRIKLIRLACLIL